MIIRSMLAVIAATTLLLTGCSRDVTGTAVTGLGPGSASPSGEDAQCATVTAPLSDIPFASKSEPRLRIPVPTGWQRKTGIDNQLIRYAIVAPGMAADGFSPNAVVTLESVRGTRDVEDLFVDNRSNLVKLMGAFDLTTEINTTCGLPSETTDYIAPPMGPAPQRPIIMHAVAAASGGSTYLVTLTIQTAEGDNPTYQRDAQQIIDGFQMLLPRT